MQLQLLLLLLLRELPHLEAGRALVVAGLKEFVMALLVHGMTTVRTRHARLTAVELRRR